MYTLKRFDQAGRNATTCHTNRLQSRPSFDASERVRSSRHIALAAIVDSDQLLGTSKTSLTDRNIQLPGGARATSPSDRDPSALGRFD